ncbi:helix-turn-helix domain-containing protein, partial [Patescibacteria group bacterium]|nr:helix-turn-helix domain-containing protein [Patescibacteria group bacterium]
MMLEDRFYTSTEVAEILGVSLRSVYRYLDEGKLDAEIKTATGRHRFTKKNILDFLYPNGETPTQSTQSSVANPVRVAAQPAARIETPIAPQEVVSDDNELPEAPMESHNDVNQDNYSEPVLDTNVKEEPIDWLAKFREAAMKFKEDANTDTVESNMTDMSTSRPEKKAQDELVYYRSMLGGLKDIAQNIDKAARNSNLNYAFTMNAGLSLHKPIKPFSVLHARVPSSDRDFFEKMLRLSPAERENAQLCLILSQTDAPLNAKVELHG